MSEDYKNKHETEEDLTKEWDNLAEDINWIEERAANGDEATKAKAQEYIKTNITRMNKILETLSAEDAPEKTIEAQETFSDEEKAQSKRIKAQETISDEEKAQSTPYERTIQNPDGTITHISADTQEEFEEKIREQAEANREAFSRY